jgi:hypothetical protein
MPAVPEPTIFARGSGEDASSSRTTIFARGSGEDASSSQTNDLWAWQRRVCQQFPNQRSLGVAAARMPAVPKPTIFGRGSGEDASSSQTNDLRRGSGEDAKRRAAGLD